jgi:LmbE family N-acetylglucosaminyl deacetylase
MGRCNPPDLRHSCLVAAHPDDEVLWFSSVLTQVERVFLCFEDCDEYPVLGPARRAVMREYPLANVEALALPEPCSVHLVDWTEPEQSRFGLRLNWQGATDESQQRYRASFDALRDVLGAKLAGMKAVFTHNPWGEYGHADHAQVSAVIESLRAELGFRVFYSGYAAHAAAGSFSARSPRSLVRAPHTAGAQQAAPNALSEARLLDVACRILAVRERDVLRAQRSARTSR